jgi:putative pyridoxal-dependent aspartate 1-decarboxylase
MADDSWAALQRLFSHGSDTEEALTQGLREFMERSEVSSPLRDEEVAKQFKSSTVPAQGQSTQDYLKFLFDKVVPHSIRTHRPKFVGHMTSALPSFVDPLGRVMTALNQNVVKLETSKAFTYYERQSLAMIHRIVYGRPNEFYEANAQSNESTLGMLVSGGTLANIAALWVARNVQLGATDAGFAGVEREGMAAALEAHGYRRAVIIGSSLMHYSLQKAADLLGLGVNGLVLLTAQSNGKVAIPELRRALEKARDERSCVVSLVAIAGTTETGAVDPLDEMADLATEFKVPLHVDAAWGGPVLFSSKYARLLKGIERADSVTIDGHKQLYTPMGVGLVMLKDPHRARAIEKAANYIVRTGSADLGRRALEGSRPAMAIFLHGALHVIGKTGYERLVDDGIEKCRFFAEQIAARPEFELLADPQLNILVYRYLPAALRDAARAQRLTSSQNVQINELNALLQTEQLLSGSSFISRTTLSHTRWGADVPIVSLRSVLANPLTTREDLRAVLDEQAELGATLEARKS